MAAAISKNCVYKQDIRSEVDQAPRESAADETKTARNHDSAAAVMLKTFRGISQLSRRVATSDGHRRILLPIRLNAAETWLREGGSVQVCNVLTVRLKCNAARVEQERPIAERRYHSRFM